MFFRRFLNEILLTSLIPLKFMVALSSFFWFLMSYWPGDIFKINQNLLYRIGFLKEGDWFGNLIFNERVWGFLFLTHSIILITTLFEERKHHLMSLLNGVFGTLIWSSSVLFCAWAHYISWADYQPPTVLSAGVVITLSQWWIFIRTWSKI